MKNRQWMLSLGVVALAVIAAGIMIARRPAVVAAPENRSAPAVQFLLAQPQTTSLAVTSQGTVSPVQQVALTLEIAARVVWMSPAFRVGNRVTADEPLLKLDTTAFELGVANAQTTLRDAELALAQEQARSAQASEDWQTTQQGDAPELSLRKPQLDAAQARVDAARAQLKKAQQDLTRCEVRAPFNAIVDSKSVELGQFVASNTQIATLLGTDHAEIRLPVAFERSLLLAPPGRQTVIDISDDARPGVHWQATLQRIDQQVDADTRVVYATAGIDAPYAKNPPLQLGQFVKATLPGMPIDNAVKLPRHAVVRDAGGSAAVFVVTNENTLARQPIQILADEPGITVAGGIAPGTRIVVTRLEVMAEGMAVSALPLPVAGVQ